LRLGVNFGKQKFDSGIWEPDDGLFAAQAGTFYYFFKHDTHLIGYYMKVEHEN